MNASNASGSSNATCSSEAAASELGIGIGLALLGSSVLAAGMRVPTGEVYGGNPAAFIRKLGKDELQEMEDKTTALSTLAAEHADEFISYGADDPGRTKRPNALMRRRPRCRGMHACGERLNSCCGSSAGVRLCYCSRALN